MKTTYKLTAALVSCIWIADVGAISRSRASQITHFGEKVTPSTISDAVQSSTVPKTASKFALSPFTSIKGGGPLHLKPEIKGTLSVLGGLLVHFVFGTMYCWGNFMSYAPDKWKYFSGAKSEHAPTPDAMLVIPLTTLGQFIAMPVGAMLTKKIGPQMTTLFAAILAFTGISLASIAPNLYIFLLCYSVIFGFGIGTGYTAPMVAGWKWFPRSKGLVSGAILTGFGAGGFIFNLIGTKLSNPNHLEATAGVFPPEVYANFPRTLQKLAVMYLITALIGCHFVRTPTPQELIDIDVSAAAKEAAEAEAKRNQDKKKSATKIKRKGKEELRLEQERAEEEAQHLEQGGDMGIALAIQAHHHHHLPAEPNANANTNATPKPVAPISPPKDLTPPEAFRTSHFWIIWLLIFCGGGAGLNTVSVYKTFGNLHPNLNADSYMALVGGLGALFNGAGRLFWGGMLDLRGFKKPFVALALLQSVVMATFPRSATTSKATYAASTCLAYFCMAGNFAMFPTLTARVFGLHDGPAIYGYLFSAFTAASVSASYITRAIVDNFGWDAVFRTMSSVSVVAAAVTVLALRAPAGRTGI